MNLPKPGESVGKHYSPIAIHEQVGVTSAHQVSGSCIPRVINEGPPDLVS